jgi:protein-disulfide isomerase
LARFSHRIAVALGALLFAWSVAPAAMAEGLPPVSEILADRMMGDANAPVTIIEYASLTCPHCAKFQSETLPEVEKNYVDTGKVKLIFRDFPLDRLALAASMMARCAPKERYFGLISSLFKGQGTWARDPDPRGALAGVGRLAGMPPGTFEACLNNREILDGILKQRKEAETKYKVNSTPTFIVNGKKVEGEQSYEAFAKIIDSALAAEK